MAGTDSASSRFCVPDGGLQPGAAAFRWAPSRTPGDPILPARAANARTRDTVASARTGTAEEHCRSIPKREERRHLLPVGCVGVRPEAKPPPPARGAIRPGSFSSIEVADARRSASRRTDARNPVAVPINRVPSRISGLRAPGFTTAEGLKGSKSHSERTASDSGDPRRSPIRPAVRVRSRQTSPSLPAPALTRAAAQSKVGSKAKPLHQPGRFGVSPANGDARQHPHRTHFVA